MRRSLSKVTIILAAVLAACNPEEQKANTQAAPGSATGDPSIVHHPEPPARPAQKQDSMPMEGTYERFTAKLIESAGVPRFSTYLPKDMIYEPTSSDEGDGHFFFTNFAGKRNDNAFLLVFIFPERTTEENARKMTQAFLLSRKPVQRSAEAGKRYAEALIQGDFQFQIDSVWHQGDIALAKNNDRFFYVARQYPEEYSEGFFPRVLYIAREWVWLQDGKGLGLTSPLPRE